MSVNTFRHLFHPGSHGGRASEKIRLPRIQRPVRGLHGVRPTVRTLPSATLRAGSAVSPRPFGATPARTRRADAGIETPAGELFSHGSPGFRLPLLCSKSKDRSKFALFFEIFTQSPPFIRFKLADFLMNFSNGGDLHPFRIAQARGAGTIFASSGIRILGQPQPLCNGGYRRRWE